MPACCSTSARRCRPRSRANSRRRSTRSTPTAAVLNAPESLTNPVLLGSLLVPLGLMHRRPRRRDESEEEHVRSLPQLGQLPLARKDVERLAHALSLQPRLLDTGAPERRQHGVVRRPSFRDALTWMEIHGQSPDVVAYWREMAAGPRTHRPHVPGPHQDGATRTRRPARCPPVGAADAGVAGDAGLGRTGSRRLRAGGFTALRRPEGGRRLRARRTARR